MEIETCEQYVLAELEASQRECERLSAKVAELEREMEEAEARKAESADGEVEPREVQIFKLGWCREEAMSVETRIWPCQLRTGTQTFVMDVHDKGRNLFEARVAKDGENARAGQHFPSYRAQELERLGLDLLRKRLLKYADDLDAEEEGEEA